jgi:hypothetical protein
MNLSTLINTQQGAPGPINQPMSREEKTSHFLGAALPTALLGGLEALNGASKGSARQTISPPLGMFPTAAGRIGTAANVTGGIFGALDLAMNWGCSSPAAGASSGMALGASVGTLIAPGIGTAIGAGVGALFGGLFGCITTGKHKDQQARDSVRDVLVQGGILNSTYQLQLPDGSLYDIGKDGGPREEFGGRRPYEVDLSNPLSQYAIGWMDPILALLAPGDTKVRNDFVGYFANAILSNAKDLTDVRRNVDFFLRTFGLSNESLAKGIAQLASVGAIDGSTAQVWMGGIQQRMDKTFEGEFEMTAKR